MLVVGLTGGIGAGKTTVARLLAEHGAVVIDVDAIGHDVLAPGGRAVTRVVEEFGPGILAPSGEIDRSKLAAVAFSDSKALARLTAISHPAINEELLERLKHVPADSIVVLDLAVLVESSLGRLPAPYGYSVVVTVEAGRSTRENRAVSRGSEREDVRRRMAQQASDLQRREIADFVINNDGDLEQLARQVDDLWRRLRSLSRSQFEDA